MKKKERKTGKESEYTFLHKNICICPIAEGKSLNTVIIALEIQTQRPILWSLSMAAINSQRAACTEEDVVKLELSDFPPSNIK